jgi:Flp pilus assembly protein TadG
MFGAKLRRLLSEDDGVAVVEFALVSSLLALMTLAIVSLGVAANEKMRLDSAARAGAQYGMVNPNDLVGMRNAALSSVEWSAGTAPAFSSSISCGCADGSVVSCAASCAVGAQRSFVTVAVTESFSLPYPVPGVPDPLELSASATIRTR